MGRQTANVMPAAAGYPVWFAVALVKVGNSAHDRRATPRLMSDRRDPKPPERNYEQGKTRQQGSEETQEGSRSQSSRPAGKSGADGRKHASTKEAIADRTSLGPRYAPDVQIVGVAGIVPAANIKNILEMNVAANRRLGPYLALSYGRVYPDVKFEQVLRPVDC